jgi:hypothetical protein
MSSLRKTIVDLVKGSLKAGVSVSFTEAELKDMGIKVPKSKLHLVKPPPAAFKVCTFKLPVQTIDKLKRKAVAANKPYNVFVNEILSRAVFRPA